MRGSWLLKEKNKLIIAAVILVLAGLVADLTGKLKTERRTNESLRQELTKAKTQTRQVVKVVRVPVKDAAGNVALDGKGEAIFREETIEASSETIETEKAISEAARTESETIETRARDRGLFIAWQPVQQANIGLVYTQRILGPLTLGVKADIDLIEPSAVTFAVLAGIRF